MFLDEAVDIDDVCYRYFDCHRTLVMGDGVLCYGALEIVGLLLLLLCSSILSLMSKCFPVGWLTVNRITQKVVDSCS